MEKLRSKPKRFGVLAVKNPGESRVNDAIEGIRKGYGWKRVRDVQISLEMRDSDFARIIGASDKTLSRARKSRTALDPIYSDRVYRAEKVLALATEVLEDRHAAIEWLRRPQVGLGGRVPLEILDTEPGAEAVELLLQRIEFGIVA